MRTAGAFILSLVLILLPSFSWAWSGMVVGVSDGDTLKVMGTHNKQVKIRLYGIDTPERGHAFTKRARQFTSKLVYGKMVELPRVGGLHHRYEWKKAA